MPFHLQPGQRVRVNVGQFQDQEGVILTVNESDGMVGVSMPESGRPGIHWFTFSQAAMILDSLTTGQAGDSPE